MDEITTNTESTAIVRRELTADAWNLIISMAETVHLSRLVPGVNSPESAAFVLMRAYELGFPLSSVSENFMLISTKAGNKVALTSQAMLAIIQSRPDVVRMKIEESTDKACTVRMRRQTGFQFAVTFSMDDAERAGLIRPQSTWQGYPPSMLRWRAISHCARIVVPDLLAGLYLASELNSDVDVIDGEIVEEHN